MWLLTTSSLYSDSLSRLLPRAARCSRRVLSCSCRRSFRMWLANSHLSNSHVELPSSELLQIFIVPKPFGDCWLAKSLKNLTIEFYEQDTCSCACYTAECLQNTSEAATISDNEKNGDSSTQSFGWFQQNFAWWLALASGPKLNAKLNKWIWTFEIKF